MHAGMDTADWLKSIVQEECGGMDSASSSPPGELISCTRPPPPPVMERRLRPQHDQPLKCPRCDSTHTKFCYYNNYSLSQPRYFCKTCRRYWTKGGSLRNVPVGGGCRKNKRPGAAAAKKPPEQLPGFLPPHLGYPQLAAASSSSSSFPADLHLSSFPALHLPHFGALTGAGPLTLMECKHDAMFECHGTLDGGELGAAFENPRNLLFLGGGGGAGDHLRGMGGLGDLSHGFSSSSSTFVDGASPAGYDPPVEGGTHGSGVFASSCHRLGLPLLEGRQGAEQYSSVDMKPAGGKLLSLEWQDQAGCNDVGRDGFGYAGGLGLWAAGMMGGHGASTSNTMI